MIEITKQERRVVQAKVKSGEIAHMCFPCAKLYSTLAPYNGTFTVRIAKCPMCDKTTQVTSASKLFGYHKFL